MPNWSSNTLVVNGDRSTLDEFYSRLVDNPDNEVRILETFLPTPEELRVPPMVTADGTEIPVMGDGEYEWCCRVWGTKWPERDVYVEDGPDNITFSFDTAWSPPVPGIGAIAKLYPSLEFNLRWKEEGMAFLGASYHRGDVQVIVEDDITVEGDPWTDEAVDAINAALAEMASTAAVLGRSQITE